MTVYEGNIANGYSLVFDAWERSGSVNVENNTSIFEERLYIKSRHTWFDPLYLIGSLKVNGVTVWNHEGQLSTRANNMLLLHSASRTITHNADGTKTVPFEATIISRMQGTFWTVPRLTVKKSHALSRIPRGPRVRHNGVYRSTVPYVKHAGKWKVAVPYVKHNGSWRVAGG